MHFLFLGPVISLVFLWMFQMTPGNTSYHITKSQLHHILFKKQGLINLAWYFHTNNTILICKIKGHRLAIVQLCDRKFYYGFMFLPVSKINFQSQGHGCLLPGDLCVTCQHWLLTSFIWYTILQIMTNLSIK